MKLVASQQNPAVRWIDALGAMSTRRKISARYSHRRT